MSKYGVVTAEKYSAKYWNLQKDYHFAASDSCVVLSGQELLEASLTLPTAFARVEDDIILVAITGISPDKNLLVSPDGRWIGRYLPEIYRPYPFRLGTTGTGEHYLCVDEDSEFIVDTAGPDDSSSIVALYDEFGEPSEQLRKVQRFLTQLIQKRVATKRICKFLLENNLLKPWSITVSNRVDTGSEHPQKPSRSKLEGYLCVNESALNTLSAEKLAELRDIGGIWVACCQLLSMKHLPNLGQIASWQQNKPKVDVSLDSFDDGGNISFDNM